MRRLIVNADDFGLHSSVNHGIIEGYRQGCLRSTSFVAAGRAAEEAAALAHDNPGLGVGIHLTLVAERPILPPEQIPSLMGENGYLLPDHTAFIRRYISGGIRKEELYAECEAQILFALKLGVRLSHIDSHHHIHIKWFILPIVVKVAKKYKLNRIRIIRNIGSTGIDLFFRRIWKFYLRLLYPSVVTTRFFGAYSSFLKLHSNSCSKNDLIELMCHPGGKEKYNDEEKLLYSDSVFNYNIKINYNDI